MRRIKLVLALAAITVAMLIAFIPSAVAEMPADTKVFFPVTLGNGASYSCTGGAPFVFNSDDSTGNCTVEQIGKPADLVCDVPIPITFVHDMHQFVANGNLCHSGIDEPVTVP